MKSKFLEKGFSGIILVTYIIILLCSIAIILAEKYKNMYLTVNSKSYLNSREKMNKMLIKFKNEISKNIFIILF